MIRFFAFAALTFIGSLPASCDQLSNHALKWEVSNRFVPFHTIAPSPDQRATIFDSYKFGPNETFERWHIRLSKNNIPSPYMRPLVNRLHNKLLHWDQDKNEHHPLILNFVKREDDPGTRADIKVWASIPGDCEWRLLEQVTTSDCRSGSFLSVPLSGATLTVRNRGHSVSKVIKPDHITIVALGDSYASGEGNPDAPGQWKSSLKIRPNGGIAWLRQKNKLMSRSEKFGVTHKRWLDDTCHRSFYSYQSLIALKLASDNPKALVSFLHYACTGAEVFDGVLVPQYQAWGAGTYVPYSQLNFAIRDLCLSDQKLDYVSATSSDTGNIDPGTFLYRRGGKGNTPRTASVLSVDPLVDNFRRSTRTLRKKTGHDYPNSGILDCPNKDMKVPDHLMISIGGNDVGFGDIVTYNLIPPSWKLQALGNFLYPDVCPSLQVEAEKYPALNQHCEKRLKKIGYDAGDLIGKDKSYGVAAKFKFLVNILESRLGVDAGNIIIPQYPDALREDQSPSNVCGPLDRKDFDLENDYYDAADETNRSNSWQGLKAATPALAMGVLGNNLLDWQFNFTRGEAASALKDFDVFRDELRSAAISSGVTFVCDTRDAFVGYGWWKGRHSNLPNAPSKIAGPKWNAADWEPYKYEAETRAIRTGNDSVLTQPGDKSITGSIHPNLTGHRLIAEAVYNQVFGK